MTLKSEIIKKKKGRSDQVKIKSILMKRNPTNKNTNIDNYPKQPNNNKTNSKLTPSNGNLAQMHVTYMVKYY